MHYIQEANRQQLSLLPESLEDYVAGNNPVRVIDRFVETLDLAALGFSRAVLSKTGRPPYSPAALLKLYIYGYLNRLRSSRQLERQTHCNVEVMWLLGRLQPDHKTIADFRKDNGKALRQVVKEFRQICRDLNLYGRELVAIDGSFFKASNSRSRHISQKSLDKDLRSLDRQIKQYLSSLDRGDKDEDGESLLDDQLAEKLARLEALQRKKQEQRESLEAAGERQRALTDSDAKLLKKGGQQVIGYNVQAAVDSKHHLIATHEVTNAGNDQGQLAPMAQDSREALGVKRVEVVADSGYHSRAGLKACEEQGVTAYVAPTNSSSSKAHKRYSKADFEYDAERDVYICPAKQMMGFVGTGRDKTGHRLRYYRAEGCTQCPLRSRCLKDGVAYRRISRWEHEQIVEANRARVQAHPDKMKRRMGLAEHPFGTIKQWCGSQHFLTRGFSNVKTEMGLNVLAYNLKRAMNVLGVEQLLEELQKRSPAPAG